MKHEIIIEGPSGRSRVVAETIESTLEGILSGTAVRSLFRHVEAWGRGCTVSVVLVEADGKRTPLGSDDSGREFFTVEELAARIRKILAPYFGEDLEALDSLELAAAKKRARAVLRSSFERSLADGPPLFRVFLLSEGGAFVSDFSVSRFGGRYAVNGPHGIAESRLTSLDLGYGLCRAIRQQMFTPSLSSEKPATVVVAMVRGDGTSIADVSFTVTANAREAAQRLAVRLMGEEREKVGRVVGAGFEDPRSRVPCLGIGRPGDVWVAIDPSGEAYVEVLSREERTNLRNDAFWLSSGRVACSDLRPTAEMLRAYRGGSEILDWRP